MKILIVPTIREIYKNQFEYCVDAKLINLLRKIFINSKIDIFSNSIKNKYNLIVLCGGNDLFLKDKKNKIRNRVNNQIYNFALKNKIQILGICLGAQFLAKKNKFKLKKNTCVVGNHEVFFNINKKKFTKYVNSFHNDSIKNDKISNINIFGVAIDNTVEAFHIKDKKILGIMWHPERYSSIKEFDRKLLKEFYATNSIISW